MDNIVGYICSTPWGTVSRTTPSLGWTPVLPAIPDGWQDAGTGAAPTGFRIIVRPGTRFPTLFPKMPRAELAAVHAPRHGARTLEPLLEPRQPELGDAAGSRR